MQVISLARNSIYITAAIVCAASPKAAEKSVTSINHNYLWSIALSTTSWCCIKQYRSNPSSHNQPTGASQASDVWQEWCLCWHWIFNASILQMLHEFQPSAYHHCRYSLAIFWNDDRILNFKTGSRFLTTAHDWHRLCLILHECQDCIFNYSFIAMIPSNEYNSSSRDAFSLSNVPKMPEVLDKPHFLWSIHQLYTWPKQNSKYQ